MMANLHGRNISLGRRWALDVHEICIKALVINLVTYYIAQFWSWSWSLWTHTKFELQQDINCRIEGFIEQQRAGHFLNRCLTVSSVGRLSPISCRGRTHRQTNLSKSLSACCSKTGLVLQDRKKKIRPWMTETRGWSEVAVPVLATMAGLLLALLIRTKASHRPRRQLPPGPRGWPILGSLSLLGTMPHQSLFKLSQQYGPLMFMRLGSVNTLVVTSPKLAEEILKTFDKTMSSRPVHIVAKHMFYNSLDIAFTPYGQYVRYLRKVCTVGLLTAKRFSQFKETREREVMAVLHFILEESDRGHPVNVAESLYTITMNSVTQMMMNQSYCVQNSGSKFALPAARSTTSLPECLREMFDLLGASNIADYVPLLEPFDPHGLKKRAKVVNRKLDEYVEENIEEHRQRRFAANTETYEEDFVDALLGFVRTKELSIESAKALMLDMLSASGDTSSVTALWVLTEVLKHPRVLRKVQEELDSVVGSHRLVREEDLVKLQYFNAVVKETLRLHPPAPFLIPHESTEDCEIEGFHIPARITVFVNAWGIQRDPAVWERPLEFDPERFLNSTKDFKGQDFEFLPFGSGRRLCPGMNLATLLVTYPLALLLHALDWTLPDGQKAEELDLSETFGLVLYKKVPLIISGKGRLPNHVVYPAQEGKQ